MDRAAHAPSRRLSVAVIQGGPSSEAEVSRASAVGVAGALAAAGHTVTRVELDAFTSESRRTGGYDVVFPVTHGAVGEDGSLQGLLEVLDLPYVGSDVLGSALAMHKRMARVVFASAGLPVARGIVARRGSARDAAAAADTARRDVGGRLVVKPSAHGSAIGVARFDETAPTADVAAAIEAVWTIDTHAVVEHFARGREVTCGILALHEAHEAKALPPTEIVSPSDAFYTYEARYAPGRSVHVCPAKLPLAVTERVQRVAIEAHRALGCRDLSRVDFVVGDDDSPDAVTLLEVNTLPGMTATSLYPEAAAAVGYSMPELCSALALHAFERGASRRVAARPLPA
jgi:D-alanine-D-alanine ligase